MRGQDFPAELLGNDGADPVDEVGQVIVEFEREGGFAAMAAAE